MDVAGGLEGAIQPLADVLNIITPMPVTKYAHGAAMAGILLLLGGQAAYYGWQLRLSDNPETIETAKARHPTLARTVTASFTFGALGGLISLVMQGKPLLQSPHATTGIIGLLLLYLQASLPLFFEDDPNARGIHAWFGSGILLFFLLHLKLGVEFALRL